MHSPHFSDLHDIPPKAFSPAAILLQLAPWLLVDLGAWGGLPLWICLFCGVCLNLGLLPALATATHWQALMQPRPQPPQEPAWLAPLAGDLDAQCARQQEPLERPRQELQAQGVSQEQQWHMLGVQLRSRPSLARPNGKRKGPCCRRRPAGWSNCCRAAALLRQAHQQSAAAP